MKSTFTTIGALLLLVNATTLFAAAKVVTVDESYQKSDNCKSCHLRIVTEWKESWHSKSHYNKDEYFKKTLDYVARKSRKSVNSMKVKCATCHNPRISITSTDESYEISAVMGLDKGSSVDKAVHDNSISEGINCVVCHNIDEIHDDLPASKRGINRISWTKSGTMTGPYSDAKSPYHKIVHHEFMDKNPNKLCFVCHANDRAMKGLVFVNMEKEYKKGSKRCVDCHMGEKRKDYASTYKMYNGKARVRDVRHHGFVGAHTDVMWVNALGLALTEKRDTILIKIENPQPHNIPSGFGSREILVKVTYRSGSKVIDEKSISLTTHYTRKRSRVTIPHLALKASKDMSIPAMGERVLKIAKVKGATSVEVELDYVLVNEEVRNLLKLEGKKWSHQSYITKESLILK
jgi:hypothetical protein